MLEFNEKLNNQVQEKTVEIKELLERFKIVAKATNDVVWDADLKNGSVWWNDNFSEKFGYKLNDETTSLHFWDDHVHPEDKDRVVGHIDHVLTRTKANVWSNEYRFMKADGSYVNIYDRSYVMRDENGDAYRMIGSMADVTDLFRVREELNQSEEKYRTLIEQATDGIFVADQGGKFLLVNSSACKLSQYSRDELLSMSIYDIVDKDNIKQQPLRFEELREGKSVITERVFRKKDGEPLQVEVNARQLSDGRMLAFIRDITEKKKAEEEVVKSNARFHIISKATSDIVWDWNLQDDSLWWNDNYYSNLGYKKQKEIVHIEDWFNNIHPDDVTKVKEKTRKAFSGNDSVWRDEYRYAKPDGTYMNFLDRGYIMRDKDGKAYRMIGSMADITDIFLIREELKQSEERYRSLIEQASDSILIYSFDGKIHSFNISAASFMGYTPEEFSKLDLKDILIGDIIIDPIKYTELLSGNAVTIYRQFKRKDGSLIEMEVTAKILSDGNVLAFGRDVTERKKAEMELQENERFLNESQAISKIGSYVLDLNTGKWKSSQELDKIFEITSDESKTINEWLSIVHPDHQKMMQEYFEQEVIGKKERFDKEYKIISKITGKECWVHGIGDLEFDANGSLIKMLGTIQDVTERKEAEVNQQRQFDELQQLYNLSVLIDRENNIEKIYNHAIDSLLSGVKADRCSIFLFDREGVMRCKASKGLSSKYILAAEGHSPWKADTAKVAPILIEDVTQAPELETLRDVILNEGIRSLGFIPLVFHGKLIGKFMIYYNTLHVFTDNEAQFTQTVAHNIAFSVERNRSNEALQASENRYHSLVEQAADAIALFDGKGKILEVNNSALQLLGYKYGELMNMSLSDILTKEEIVNNPVQYDLLGKGLSTIKQRKMRRKDGSIVITEVNSKILPDGRFLSMVRDLTDRIEAQKQIEREKELSDKIIDSLPGVFYFFDQNGKFIRWNKQLEIVTGYNSKEISAMHPIRFFQGEGAKYIGQRIAKVFSEGISDAETDLISKDGSSRPYYFKAILIDFNGKSCLLGTGIDISDRKKAEKELSDSYKSIRKLTSHLQNVREEDRAHIAREIHDELGQQLTVLKMDVSWVNKKIGTTDDVIKQKMKGLLTMLDETVKTVRRISSELRPSLLDDLGLTAAMEWQLHEFKKRSDIKISFTAPETEMKLPDTIKIGLFRIFQESLTNVVRHSNAKNLKVGLEHKDDNFILTIADDGKGFDKEKIADKRTLGILGMKERTSMIGGTYEITSTPGNGTVVEVAIPMNGQN